MIYTRGEPGVTCLIVGALDILIYGVGRKDGP